MLKIFLTKKLIEPLHRVVVFGNRVKMLSYHFSQLLPQNESLSGLDVGCGTGELAKNIQLLRPRIEISGVDVLVRKNTMINVIEYDGKRLPFEDKSYDFTILSDVLHHTDDPVRIIQECSRVSRKFTLLKDHICESWRDKIILRFMDWIGNRSYDVYLPYNYLSKREWEQLYKASKVVCEAETDKLNLYPQPFSIIFDSTLHFVARLAIAEVTTDEFN